MRMKSRLFAILICIFTYCLFLMEDKFQTHAWFAAETIAEGQLTNATTDDLITVSTSEVTYQENCKISQEIVVENISDIEIPIKLLKQHKILMPGETFNASFDQLVSCEQNEVQYQLIGFNQFIDMLIQIPLDPTKLLASVEMEEENNQDSETEEIGDQTDWDDNTALEGNEELEDSNSDSD